MGYHLLCRFMVFNFVPFKTFRNEILQEFRQQTSEFIVRPFTLFFGHGPVLFVVQGEVLVAQEEALQRRPASPDEEVLRDLFREELAEDVDRVPEELLVSSVAEEGLDGGGDRQDRDESLVYLVDAVVHTVVGVDDVLQVQFPGHRYAFAVVVEVGMPDRSTGERVHEDHLAHVFDQSS